MQPSTPPAKADELAPEERKALISRMRRIEGQARAVERMIAEADSCERILHQIAAMRGALGRLGTELVACQAAQELTRDSGRNAKQTLSYWMNKIGI